MTSSRGRALASTYIHTNSERLLLSSISSTKAIFGRFSVQSDIQIVNRGPFKY